MGLALNHLQRHVIRLDPKWRNGDYPAHDVSRRADLRWRARSPCAPTSRPNCSPPASGATPTATEKIRGPDPDGRFDVAGYLDHQGEKFVQRFDANSYLAISKTMDSFDPVRSHGSPQAAYGRIRAHVTLVGISSDWLFPAADVRSLASSSPPPACSASITRSTSSHGHDAFLAEPEKLAAILAAHL